MSETFIRYFCIYTDTSSSQAAV